MDSEDGWISISNRADLNAIDFLADNFYVAEDLEAAQSKRQLIEEDYNQRKEAKAKKTADKKAAKKAAQLKIELSRPSPRYSEVFGAIKTATESV